MFDTYINRGSPEVCSIQNFNRQMEKDELLLSNENKNQTITQKDEDELFDLYITPYSEKQVKVLKMKDLSINQDTTILKGSHGEEFAFKLKCQQYEQEMRRLKKIIFKKNKVIGNLTEELKIYYQKSKKSDKNKGSLYMCNSQQYQPTKYDKECKQNQCESIKCRNQLGFLQKNNIELYQQMNSCKKKYLNLEQQMQKIKQQLQKFRQLAGKIDIQNKSLKKENMSLLKSTKKYLNQGAQEIKIMSKMRQVLAEKLSLKQMNIQLHDFNPKNKCSNSKVRSQRKTKQSRRKQQLNDILTFSKSVQKRITNQKSQKQRCQSQYTRKITF